MNLKLLIEQAILEQKLINIAEQAQMIVEDLNNLRDFSDEANAAAEEAKNTQRQTKEELDLTSLNALRDQLKNFLFTALRKTFNNKQLDQYIDLILFDPDKVIGPSGERLFNKQENMRGLRYLKTEFIGDGL